MLTEGTPTTEAQLVKDRTLVLQVTIHSLSFRKTIRADDPNISVGDAQDKKRFTHRKKTLEGPEIEALHSQEGEIREWVSKHSLAGDLGLSFRLIALPMFPLIDERLEAFQEARQALVEELVEKYPHRMDEAKPALGCHWDIHDYPRIKKLRQSFGIEWNYRTTLDLPPTMDQIDSAIAGRERKKHAKEAQKILDVAEQGMIETFHGMIQHLASRLGTEEDGTQTALHKTAVLNLQEFLKFVHMQNVRGRDDIDELATQAQKLLEGVTTKQLRKKGEFREQIRQQMDALARKLDPLVIRAAARKIWELDDEG